MTYAPTNPVVWTEIPVTDLAASSSFYEAVTGLTLIQSEFGGGPVAIFQAAEQSGVSCNLFVGTPANSAAGPRLHLLCQGPLEQTLERVTAAGGTVLSPMIDIPEGRFAYCADLDGTMVAFFQAPDQAAA